MAKTERRERGETVLELDRVSYRRGDNLILEEVSLRIRRGEHWAVLGANGSGKTTLLSLITGDAWPTEGAVSVLGERCGEVDLRLLRRRIGYVTSALFDRVPGGESCLEVILSGRFASLGLFEASGGEDRERAQAVAEFVGLGRVLDRPYRLLSFGERQRALLGRALMPKPELLLLDEPCEGLDLAGREKVLDSLESLTGDNPSLTVVLVTHRLEEIPPGIGHALLLRQGRVLASGKKFDTLSSVNLSAAMDLPVEVVRRNGRLYSVV